MKRTVQILYVIILLFFLVCFLRECALFHGKERILSDDLYFVTHSVFRTCFVSNYTWTSPSNYAVITIPDVQDGYRVTSLGGSVGAGVPSPFIINFPYTLYSCPENTLPDQAQIDQYHLVINLGRNLREDKLVVMDYYHCLENNQFIQVLVTINCAEENPVFYSIDGKLFRRSDDSLVEGFFYYSDYY